MKTADILMIAAGVGIVGYLAYKNKDQFQKPLTDSDNQPLRAGFDTGTNNGNGYQTEEEKPAADPVVLSKPALLPFTTVPVKNAEVVNDDQEFQTGEKSSDTFSVMELVKKVNSPVLPIPKYNTTTPYTEETPVLKPAVADVSPSAPVVSLTEQQEQPTTLLYNNTAQYISDRDAYKPETVMYAQDF